MSYRAIIFDLDGTLLDTLDDIANAANRALAGQGFPEHPTRQYREFIGEGVNRLMLRALPEEIHDEATVQACVEAYRKEYALNWNDKTKPYQGVAEMLDGVVARGIRLAVLSNKPDLFTQQCVRELLPKWTFEVVIGASDALPRKPNPASALEIARRLDASSGECVYVGDSGVDMQTAQAAGMFAVGVLWGFRGRAELLSEGAQALAETPHEILELLDVMRHGS